MYLVKKQAKTISAQKLSVNDVISIDKKWYVVREKLNLNDKIKLTGLRDGKKYTSTAVVNFGVVHDYRKIGVLVEDRFIEKI